MGSVYATMLLTGAVLSVNSTAVAAEALDVAATTGTPAPIRIPADSALEAEGAVIGRIVVDRESVYSANDTQGRPVRKAMDSLHVNTRERVIRQLLLFKEGDRYSGRLIAESARLLRARPYIVDASITKLAYHDGEIDLQVTTKDSWTLFPSVGVSRSGGFTNSGVALQDLNVMGLGDQLSVGHTRTVDRFSTQLSGAANNIAGSRVNAEASYSDNSDGISKSAAVERPFYALDTRWAAGVNASALAQTDSLYDLGNIVDQFRDHAQYAQAYTGWSSGIHGGWITRLTVGATDDEHRFSTLSNSTVSTLLPQDRRLIYPWLGIEVLQDDFVELQNHNQMGRTEDVGLGWHIAATLGLAEPAFGSDRHALIGSLSVRLGTQPSASQTLTVASSFSGRDEDNTLRNAVLDNRLRWYWQQSPHWLSYASASSTIGHALDLDNQILLGGDNGLRGYPLRYQDGTGRVLLTAEQRFISDAYLFGTWRLGAAVFADSGKVWGRPPLSSPNQGMLTDVGAGLRLGSTAFGNVAHVDFAIPQGTHPDAQHGQWLIQIQTSF